MHVEEILLHMESVDSPINPVTTDPKEARKKIENSVVQMIVYKNRVIGIIAYEVRDVLNAHITEIAILPNFQGTGIGSAVLVMILELKQKGFKFIELKTHPSNKARNLYERYGFKFVGRIENYKSSGTPRPVLRRGFMTN